MPPTFKTKGRPQATRRAAFLEEPDEAPAPAGEGGHEAMAVEDVKIAQRLRRRPRGLPAAAAEELSDDEVNPASDQIGGLLKRQFTERGSQNTSHEDRHLAEYLQRRLKEMQPSESTVADGNAAAAEKTREEKLYEIDERLKVPDALQSESDRINWMTGLMEVPPSLESKLENIERTEAAKRELLRLGKPEPAEDPSTHLLRRAFGSRFLQDNRQRTQKATDDAALSRFRKRFKQF